MTYLLIPEVRDKMGSVQSLSAREVLLTRETLIPVLRGERTLRHTNNKSDPGPELTSDCHFRGSSITSPSLGEHTIKRGLQSTFNVKLSKQKILCLGVHLIGRGLTHNSLGPGFNPHY